jgi:hypothetical protein
MEIYYSTDVEANGQIPGIYSMLSLGCAAFTGEGKLLGTYSANLDVLSGAKEDPDTMAWWRTQPKAWEECRQNTRHPEIVMKEFIKWVWSIKYNGEKISPVFVGYPAGFDFTFVYYYLMAFAGESPFSFSALDIKSFAMAVLGTNFRGTTKRAFPKRWFGKSKHSHIAVEDAIEQGELFCNILKEAKQTNSLVKTSNI